MVIVNGLIWWAKILGKPVTDDYGTRWSFDLSLDEDNFKKLLDEGMSDRYLRQPVNPKTGKEHISNSVYLTFDRNAVKKNGEPAKPFRVVGKTKDKDGNWVEWNQNKLIGNGSEVAVRVILNEKTWKKDTWLGPSALEIQVRELVEYKPYEDFKPDSDAPEEGW
jgi:hypothetical protein